MSLPEVVPAGDAGDGYAATIDPDWQQGRTAYGGASAALALTAVKQASSDLPPLRSAQIAFIGPLAGPVRLVPSLLRRGRNSAFIGCDVIGETGLGLRALFVFMTSRPSAIAHVDLPVPAHDPPGNAPIDSARLGGFLGQFDLAHAGRPVGGFLRWARLHDAPRDAEVELVAIADALPPAAMALADGWGPGVDGHLAAERRDEPSAHARRMVAAWSPQRPRRGRHRSPIDDDMEPRR